MNKVKKTDHVPDAQTYVLMGRDGEEQTVHAIMLGQASSEKDYKDRWFEIDILFDPIEDEYIVCTRGMSRLPGEQTRARIMRTHSAMAVAECLIVTRNNLRYLTTPARSAIAQAAQYDDDMYDVWSLFATSQAQPVA